MFWIYKCFLECIFKPTDVFVRGPHDNQNQIGSSKKYVEFEVLEICIEDTVYNTRDIHEMMSITGFLWDSNKKLLKFEFLLTLI